MKETSPDAHTTCGQSTVLSHDMGAPLASRSPSAYGGFFLQAQATKTEADVLDVARGVSACLGAKSKGRSRE